MQWLKTDILFLRDALDQGMAIAQIAGFLGKDEAEVQKKAEEIKRVQAPKRETDSG
jgi:hypothetical protein